MDRAFTMFTMQRVVVLISFGNNENGQLGYGDTNKRGDGANEMGDNLKTVELPTGFIVDSYYLSGYATYILSTSGEVVCWGGNARGECGVGHADKIGDGAGEMGDSLETIDFGTDFNPVQLGGGKMNGCAMSAKQDWKWYVVCVSPSCIFCCCLSLFLCAYSVDVCDTKLGVQPLRCSGSG